MLIQDVMTKDVITVPSDTPIGDTMKIMKEHNFRRLPVVDNGKLVTGGGDGKACEQIIACINKLKIGMKVIWTLKSPGADRKDLIVHLDTEDASKVIEALGKLGFEASVRAR